MMMLPLEHGHPAIAPTLDLHARDKLCLAYHHVTSIVDAPAASRGIQPG